MGCEDPCEAPPMIQITIKTRLNLKDAKKLGMAGAGSYNRPGTGVEYVEVIMQKVKHVLSNKVAEGSSS